MKDVSKLFFIIIFIGIIAATGFTQTDYNSFTIDGKLYEVFEGSMDYYGDIYSETAIIVDLELFSEDNIYIYFEMFIPEGNKRLVEGTYNYYFSSDKDYKPFTYCWGGVDIELYGKEIYYEIIDGTVTVSVSGSGNNTIYTITVDCNLVDEDNNSAGAIKGTYQGPLEWYD